MLISKGTCCRRNPGGNRGSWGEEWGLLKVVTQCLWKSIHLLDVCVVKEAAEVAGITIFASSTLTAT